MDRVGPSRPIFIWAKANCHETLSRAGVSPCLSRFQKIGSVEDNGFESDPQIIPWLEPFPAIVCQMRAVGGHLCLFHPNDRMD